VALKLSIAKKIEQLPPSKLDEDLKNLNLKAESLQRELRNLVKSAHPEEKLSRWIKIGLQMLKADKLKLAIEGKLDAIPWLANHFKLANNMVRPLWVLVFRIFWNDIEPALCNPELVFQTITAGRPDAAQILKTQEGIEWLNSYCERFYHFLRVYTYSFPCIICGIKIDAINDEWVKVAVEDGYMHASCYQKISSHH
jgi:hypothetical protein